MNMLECFEKKCICTSLNDVRVYGRVMEASKYGLIVKPLVQKMPYDRRLEKSVIGNQLAFIPYGKTFYVVDPVETDLYYAATGEKVTL